MSQPATLREMRWWDVETLLPLEAELFGEDAWSAETWWSELAQDGRHYVLVDGGCAGTVDAYAGVSVVGADADLMTVAVRPQRQGQGWARILVQHLLDTARERGAHQMLLEVRADNGAAQRLYLSLGFERIAVRRGYYQSSSGVVDAWIMRRRPLDIGADPASSLRR